MILANVVYYEPWWMQIAKAIVIFAVGLQIVPVALMADRKVMDAAVADLTKITGQKPKLCMSKKSIASFKVRENLAIGTMVTLRGERMWVFFDRLVTIAIPRIRDFRGINPRSFDGRGNYNVGVKEQIIFPELDYDKIDVLRTARVRRAKLYFLRDLKGKAARMKETSRKQPVS